MHGRKTQNGFEMLDGKHERKRDKLEDLGVDGRTILKLILKETEWEGWD
jgi:hypothetical protein